MSTILDEKLTTSNDLLANRFTRTMLGDAMLNGVADPEEFEPDVLLKGCSHQIFTGPEQGKTWLALWFTKNAIKRGQMVIYFDMEMGKRKVLERLDALGVDGYEADEYMHYYFVPTMDMSKEARTEYTDLLDDIKPDLIIFDSWIGCLAACGLEENSPTNVEQWANGYVHPAKKRGCTVVILDHVPHDANRSRGATRKKDLVDVQWHLKKKQPFDRSTVGYIQLTREKDREAWLPQRVGFAVGGTEDGFVFRRSEGMVLDSPGDQLPESAKEAERALKTFGEAGATYTQWRNATQWKDDEPMPDSTFRSARNKLMDPDHKLVRQDDDRYYSNNSK